MFLAAIHGLLTCSSTEVLMNKLYSPTNWLAGSSSKSHWISICSAVSMSVVWNRDDGKIFEKSFSPTAARNKWLFEEERWKGFLQRLDGNWIVLCHPILVVIAFHQFIIFPWDRNGCAYKFFKVCHAFFVAELLQKILNLNVMLSLRFRWLEVKDIPSHFL